LRISDLKNWSKKENKGINRDLNNNKTSTKHAVSMLKPNLRYRELVLYAVIYTAYNDYILDILGVLH